MRGSIWRCHHDLRPMVCIIRLIPQLPVALLQSSPSAVDRHAYGLTGCWLPGCWLNGCWLNGCWLNGCWVTRCWVTGCWPDSRRPVPVEFLLSSNPLCFQSSLPPYLQRHIPVRLFLMLLWLSLGWQGLGGKGSRVNSHGAGLDMLLIVKTAKRNLEAGCIDNKLLLWTGK